MNGIMILFKLSLIEILFHRWNEAFFFSPTKTRSTLSKLKEIMEPDVYRCSPRSTIILFDPEFNPPPSGDGHGENSSETVGSTFIEWEEDGHNLINPDSRLNSSVLIRSVGRKSSRKRVSAENGSWKRPSIDSPRMTMDARGRGRVYIEGARIRDNGKRRRIATVLSLPNFRTDFRPSFSVSGWRLERRSQ